MPIAEDKVRETLKQVIDPELFVNVVDLGLIYESQGRLDEAMGAYKEAVHADEVYVLPYIQLVHMAYARQDWRESAALAEKVIALDPVTLIDSYFVSALANFNLGQLDMAEKRAQQGQRIDYLHSFPQFHLILANVFMLRKDTSNSVQELRNYLDLVPNAENAAIVRSRLRILEEQAGTDEKRMPSDEK